MVQVILSSMILAIGSLLGVVDRMMDDRIMRSAWFR
jgi:hypothetical protein